MRQRNSARGILLNEAGEVLLMKYENNSPVDPKNPSVLQYWATPGGGIRDGEQHEDALRREIREELGIDKLTIGRLLGVRNIVLDLPSKGLVHSRERYYACWTNKDSILTHAGLTASERVVFRGAQWWPVEALSRNDFTIRPPNLLALVREAANPNSTEVLCIDE